MRGAGNAVLLLWVSCVAATSPRLVPHGPVLSGGGAGSLHRLRGGRTDLIPFCTESEKAVLTRLESKPRRLHTKEEKKVVSAVRKRYEQRRKAFQFQVLRAVGLGVLFGHPLVSGNLPLSMFAPLLFRCVLNSISLAILVVWSCLLVTLPRTLRQMFMLTMTIPVMVREKAELEKRSELTPRIIGHFFRKRADEPASPKPWRQWVVGPVSRRSSSLVEGRRGLLISLLLQGYLFASCALLFLVAVGSRLWHLAVRRAPVLTMIEGPRVRRAVLLTYAALSLTHVHFVVYDALAVGHARAFPELAKKKAPAAHKP